ncbi:hypothetical protein [Cytobacillus sp. FSL H8-0458]
MNFSRSDFFYCYNKNMCLIIYRSMGYHSSILEWSQKANAYTAYIT